MLVYDLWDNMHDFIDAKVSMGKIAHYYVILIPAWIVTIMPMTLLLSLLYVLSDMSKHGELTAMRASGLDLFRLLSGFFVVGICVAMQMLALNLSWAPRALYESKALLEESKQSSDPGAVVEKVTYRDIPGNRFWCVKLLDPKNLRADDIEITQDEEIVKNGERTIRTQKRISARYGIYSQGRWILNHVLIYDYTRDPWDPLSVQREPVYSDPKMTESPRQFIAADKKTKRMTTPELLENLKFKARLSPKQYAMYNTELHSRIAFPMSNFIVFLIGIPFGVVGQRSSNFLAVTYALAAFGVYMVAISFFAALAQRSIIPAWFGAWLPNILMGGAGIYLIRRIR